MKLGQVGAVQRDLGRLFEGQSVAGLGEVQLLERFIDRRDESAFAALVARHGPMVLGVCRRFLTDPLDVEDAFQATFLVLVRRAEGLRGRDCLAPWLFGVARKVANRARLDLRKRRAREVPGAEVIARISGVDDHRHEMARAMIEEIDQLPATLREPILLCCVEGLTYDETATRLRTTSTAIRGRLARGRERLRDRLIRRGFAPSAVALGALLSAEAVSAAVPFHLLKLTTIQALKTGMIPVGVEALAEGVIQTMIVTKSKILAATLVACGIAGTSLGVFGQQPTKPEIKSDSEADRLGQVEQKLDRVLKALESRDQPRAASVFGNPPELPAPPTPTPPPAVPQPPAQTGGQAKSYIGTRTPRAKAALSLGERLENVEEKLESLEARIARLEQRLGADIRPNPTSAKTTTRTEALRRLRILPDNVPAAKSKGDVKPNEDEDGDPDDRVTARTIRRRSGTTTTTSPDVDPPAPKPE